MENEFKNNLDQIISQEKSGKAMTDKAIKEKEDLIKQAKNEAEQEVFKYSEQIKEDYQKEKFKIDSTKISMDEKEKNFQSEIKIIKNDFLNNKNIVIDYLIENVLLVDITVPDVVRGKFSEKLK